MPHNRVYSSSQDSTPGTSVRKLRNNAGSSRSLPYGFLPVGATFIASLKTKSFVSECGCRSSVSSLKPRAEYHVQAAAGCTYPLCPHWPDNHSTQHSDTEAHVSTCLQKPVQAQPPEPLTLTLRDSAACLDPRWVTGPGLSRVFFIIIIYFRYFI